VPIGVEPLPQAVDKGPRYRIWRCDKFPWLKVTIPVWREPGGPLEETVEFGGGSLDMQKEAEERGLTMEQVGQADEVLARTPHVYPGILHRGEKIICPECGATFKDVLKFQLHEAYTHAETQKYAWQFKALSKI